MVSLQSDGKAIFKVVIGALIAIAMLSVIATQVFVETNTLGVINGTVTAPAVNATLDLTGRALVGDGVVLNATNSSGADQTTLGVFVQTGTGDNGLRSVQLFVNDTGAAFAAQSVNITYTYEPDGYLPLLSSRSVANLIVIFGALGILIFVIVVFIKDGSLGKLIGR